MPIFKIIGESVETGERKAFFFDSKTTRISDTEFVESEPIPVKDIGKAGHKGQLPFSQIKIQLGLSCNYACSYCSQRTVERASETTPKDIDAFLEMLDKVPKTCNVRFEFWGGEPFVYWKTLKPLAERIREKYPDSLFMTVTNGSLLTKEIVDWLVETGFSIAISHDGPGQAERSGDPLVDNYEAIAYAVEKLVPQNRMSISVMLNRQNLSRLAAVKFFKEKFPGYDINMSEMGFVAPYNDGGADAIDFTKADHFEVRRNLWAELRFQSVVGASCAGQRSLVESVVNANRAYHQVNRCYGQKCGMDGHMSLAIDLRGNVLTCQNVSAVSIAPNGESHKIGHINDLAGIALKTSRHWTTRDNCPTCPVVTLCNGNCMFLEGEGFELACEAYYSDMIGLFAIAFEQLTGFVPFYIDDERVPLHKRDLWGSHYDWSKEGEKVKQKIIPIKSIP